MSRIRHHDLPIGNPKDYGSTKKYDPVTAIGAAVGGEVIGSVLNADASRKAAHTQADAARQSMDLQRQGLAQQAYETAPERDVGALALYQLASMLGIDPRQAFPGGIPGEGPMGIGKLPTPGAPGSEFGSLNKQFTMADFLANQDPSYQFRQEQGQKGIESSAAARGMQLSGSNLKDLTSFNQGLASEEYQNAWQRFQAKQGNDFSRLAELAGMGTQAREQLGASAANLGQSLGNTQEGIGNALAAGKIGQANAFSQPLQQAGELGLLYGAGAFNPKVGTKG